MPKTNSKKEKTTSKKPKKSELPEEVQERPKPAKKRSFFDPVDAKQSFPNLENDILKFWKEENIFRKTLDHRKDGKQFIFYEGPPTANGKPGVHHVIARV